MLKTIKQYHDKDVEGIKCTCYVIALEKKKHSGLLTTKIGTWIHSNIVI